MAKSKRQYNNDYPSVTQVIAQLRSPALEYWFKSHTLEEINRLSARGKQIGTEMHDCIQDFIEKGESKIDTQYPDEITMALKSFQLFRKENPHINLKRSEIKLTSEQYKYNGTIDCLSDSILVDWKSSTCKEKEKPEIYFEAKIQVSAYIHLLNECEKLGFNEGLIVPIAKDKIAYNTYFMKHNEVYDCFNEVFLPLLKVFNYQKRSK